ncbi:hypothetical protein ABH905_004089 [Pseudomonas frederiksbergensis]
MRCSHSFITAPPTQHMTLKAPNARHKPPFLNLPATDFAARYAPVRPHRHINPNLVYRMR